MGNGDRDSVERLTQSLALSTALLAMLSASIAVGISGCVALPLLSAIPSAVSFVYNVATDKKSDDTDTADADAKSQDQDAAPTTAAVSDSKPKPLTPDNICHLMALARPDLIVVELRKNTAGAPEYRELKLQPGTEDAHWAPVIDNQGGADGWRPAVNFLQMNFKPKLTEVIPDSGTCYLAYAPIALNPNNPMPPVEAKTAPGNASGDFDWQGREYQYRVERTLPCLSPSS